MASPDAAFDSAVNKILSARYYHMQAAAGAWTALAQAAGVESSALTSQAGSTALEPGVGLIALADRIEATGGWAESAGQTAQVIAEQLRSASDSAAAAAERALELDDQYWEVEQWETDRINTLDVGMGVVQTNLVANERKNALKTEALNVLNNLGDDFSRVIGAEPPPAPGGGSGGTGSVGDGITPVASGDTLSAVGSGVSSTADYQTPNGAYVGSGTYPGSRVVGPEGGDFAGWVQSPSTGNLVDPATGREYDPSTGQWIDPNTGLGFGQAGDQSGRWEGLGTGPGTVPGAVPGGYPGVASPGLTTPGLTPGALPGYSGSGIADLGPWYNGQVPPSIAQSGPARSQMTQQALNNMGRRARVANSFAWREAAQGGRPYTPPPGAAAAGRQGYGPGRSGQAAGRGGTGGVRAGGVGAGRVGAGGVRAGMAPPGAAAHGANARDGGRRTGVAGRGTALREPARTWRSGVKDVSAGSRLAGRSTTAPPVGAGARNQRDKDEKARQFGPTELTEDPSVWTSSRPATHGVLGE
ncbi:hypothetical protein [Streptomyces sp. RFCAC02]|uniref:hypothetical protein n=1 Tax=Streptomyces sp. RFCAC02 TaxID=2499143 RepID=UPI001021F407|nr:hypothetical protein [Streptomyces sp. RFCAC02]